MTIKDMTDDQFACYAVLCEVFGGEHHVPPVSAFGDGIKTNVYVGQLATFDHNYLTRLVVLAHDACVRAEIVPGEPRMIGVALWKRKGREGAISERHPTIENAIKTIRGTP